MDRTIQDLKASAGVGESAQPMPERIRLALLSTVSSRMVEVRSYRESVLRTHELGCLTAAANWLMGPGKSDKFRVQGAIHQYEVEAIHIDRCGNACRVDEDCVAHSFSVYRRPMSPVEGVARAELFGDFDTRHEAEQAASLAAIKDTGSAGEH